MQKTVLLYMDQKPGDVARTPIQNPVFVNKCLLTYVEYGDLKKIERTTIFEQRRIQ